MNKITFIRSFVCNTKRPSVKQSIKCQVSSNLADKPTLAVLPPPFETAWQESDSYAFSYHQWEPIRNSQLIRKYKEIPVYIRIQIPKADGPPPFETAWWESDSYTFSYRQWEPIRNSQLIRKYKEIPVYIRIQIPKADGPPH